jgi:PhnB protein
MTATETALKVETYLFFNGRCEEAIEYYKRTLGAEVDMMMRYKDMPPEAAAQGKFPAEAKNKIMHVSFRIGETKLMAADNCCSDNKGGIEGFSLCIPAADEAQAKKVFNALAADGQVKMPLNKTFFSPAFGMLTDKFGIGWMIIVQQSM